MSRPPAWYGPPTAEELRAERQRRAALRAEGESHAQQMARWRRDPVAFTDEAFTWLRGEGQTAYQRDILRHLVTARRAAVRGPHGPGKAQPDDLDIDTPDGRRRFGDLQVGDRVFGSSGQPVRVMAVWPWGVRPVYRVTFDDGASTLCSAEHEWAVQRGTSSDWSGRPPPWQTFTTEALSASGVTRSNGIGRARRFHIPVTGWDYPPRWVPVDPYTLGTWLGDGGRRTGYMHARDKEIHRQIEAAGYVLRPVAAGGVWVHGLLPGLRTLGLYECGSHTKFIPRVYLENARPHREAMLRGLLDTDGWVTREGQLVYNSVSPALADGVAWLARSLGGKARRSETRNAYGPVYNVRLTMPAGDWVLVERKRERMRFVSQKRYLQRWIAAIAPAGAAAQRCITVDAPDGLYLCNDGIVTHNTAMAAQAILWFALTREGLDWKCVSTASVWRQLERYLWPEVHKWARRLRWEVIGRAPFDRHLELTGMSLKLSGGAAFAVASDEPALIEGAHADHMLYIFDEAKTIRSETFDAAEGAFSGAGQDTGREALALIISTPGEPHGRFYDIHARRAGYDDWWTRHITRDETIASGRMSAEWARMRAEQWGATSPVYANRVLGEFAASETDGVVPLAWIEAANERWHAWREGGGDPDTGALTAVGCDVGGEGEQADRSVLALRAGDVLAALRRLPRRDTMVTAGALLGVLRARGGRGIVDSTGIGAGVFHRVREQIAEDYALARSASVVAFTASAKCEALDRSGELGFANLRSAAWWGLRERLDPAFGPTVALPPDDRLTGDLTAPRWRVMSGGKIQVESKDDVIKRIKRETGEERSTDDGDAVVQAFAAELLRGPDTTGFPVALLRDNWRGSI